MSLAPFYVACEKLVSVLAEKGFHVDPQLLIPQPNVQHNILNEFTRTDFYTKALEYYLDKGGLWAYDLKNRPSPANWHIVNLACNKKSDSSVGDYFYCATCKQDALALVIYELDTQGLIPSHVKCDQDNLAFYSDKELLAEIYIPHFERVEHTLNHRIETALEKRFWNDAEDVVTKRLQKIPNLGQIKSSECATYPMLVSTKSLANQMERFLRKILHYRAKRSELLEITAKFYDYESWNHFCGAEKQYADHLKRPFMIYTKTGPEVNSLDFTLGEVDAIAMLSKKVDRRVDKKTFSLYEFDGMSLNAHPPLPNTEGLYIRPIRRVYPEDLPTGGIALKLLSEEDITEAIYDHLGSNSPSFTQKLHKRAQRRSIDSSYLMLSDWLIYIKSSSSGDVLVLEKFDHHKEQMIDKIIGDLYKCWFFFNEETNTYWLSIDRHEKAQIELSDFNGSDILKIEKQFIIKANWCFNDLEFLLNF
ncbi:hypothetical protein [Pseudoalteromonas maricaloris]|uniref:hypothetical protein n=1 Tax=Pseudoalteromonas maricaloris TaxID=184924 RepID=UPI003C26529E